MNFPRTDKLARALATVALAAATAGGLSSCSQGDAAGGESAEAPSRSAGEPRVTLAGAAADVAATGLVSASRN